MGNLTKKQILNIAKEEKVHYVRLQFTDMLGSLKAVEIPVSKLEDALNNQIMFDGSSIEGFVRIKEADMYLRPDLDTWLILNFEDSSYGKVARLICDVYTPYGKPFPVQPGCPGGGSRRRRLYSSRVEGQNSGFSGQSL